MKSRLQPAPDTSANDPIVQTKHGWLRGVRQFDVESFKGIPYASAPIGEFRWRPPQPARDWSGVRDARKYCSDCAQPGWPRNTNSIAPGSSEDCLFLNIWRPAGAKAKDGLPVMVWIHGGGFVGGSGSRAETDGSEFARNGVILVTINYRLGRLGHFAFPALSAEYPDEFKGSYAFMDQIKALSWINQNISAFGGNQDNVTIFGQSAGGVSVHHLLTLPSARGLFHKAILQSSGGRDGILTGRPLDKDNIDSLYPISAEHIGINFAQRHGIIGTDATALTKLRDLSVEQIIDGGAEASTSDGKRIYPGPILDGIFMTETPQASYNHGNIPEIPIIIGSNSAEISAGFVNARTKLELFSLFDNLSDEAAQTYDPEGKNEFGEILTLVNTDKVWAEPARFTAEAFKKKMNKVFLYLFSYVPDTLRSRFRFGAPHSSEIAYIFNNLNARWGNIPPSSKDKDVAKLLNTYWINFAKTGNPNGFRLPHWPAFQLKSNDLLEIQHDGNPAGKPDPRKKRLDLIERELRNNKLINKGV